MRVTKISEQQKNHDRVNVFIDGKYSFSLTLNQLLESKLKLGTELDEQAVKEYLRLSEEGKLKVRTFDWLTLRPRSAKELKDYLRKKKLSDEVITAWTADFQNKNYQNDTSFALWWVGQRRKQLKSESYIRQELRTKGVASEIINEALATDENSDTDALAALIEKKRRQLKYQDNQMLLEYLVRKGYRYSLVKELLAAE